jgi:uncharacterized protein YjbI with pentapeptide repeats
MESVYIEDENFEKRDFTATPLPLGEYENCTFKDCEFANTDLREIRFVDCTFLSCNLTMAHLAGTVLRDINFINCKMVGLHFENCSQFALSFSIDNCNLMHASFFRTKIKSTVFKNSVLHDVDFTDCDLSGCVFDRCDFKGAKFDNTIIEKADFSTAFNYSIDPEVNRMKKAKFSMAGVAGLLDKYDIVIDS